MWWVVVLVGLASAGPAHDVFSDFAHCPNRCNERGVCVDDRCLCARGWQGNACETPTCPVVCKNGGQCVGSACSCVNGFHGIDCGLEPCPNNCSSNGLCIRGKCVCSSGFSGAECEVVSIPCMNNCSKALGQGECFNGVCFCLSGWAGIDCSQRVCSNACSGHGTCKLDANASTCECHRGYSGFDCSNKECPSQCHLHGTCDPATGTCSCHLNWGGEECDTPECHPNCGPHGVCIGGDDGGTVCKCEGGWSGAWCQQRECLNSCSFRGACNQDTGQCECRPEYTGSDCSYTTVGNKHMRGCQTRADCSDHGLCVNTHCKCMAGYFGDVCQHTFPDRSESCPNGCSGNGLCNAEHHCVCVFPNTGADCADVECLEECGQHQRCVFGQCVCLNNTRGGPNCDKRLCANACSHHGKCHTATGVCECDLGFNGVDCSIRLCANNCSGHGVCGGDMGCVCDEGWAGPDCSLRPCPRSCSHHGLCDPATATCSCAPGWWGEACELKQCVSQQCSGHGVCVNGTCECTKSWTGPICANRTCPRNCNAPRGGVCQEDFSCKCKKGYFGEDCALIQPLSVSCPRGCSGHGHCMSQSCACVAGWTGLACGIRLCGENCFAHEQHGVCNASKVCECAEGYGGMHCDKVLCKNQCSHPHGHCNFTTGRCKCAPGFSGDDCSQRIQNTKCAHGRSSEGPCLCEAGWTGFMCDERMCRDSCSNNGECANGTCFCAPGFEGDNCAFGSAKSNYKHDCDLRCARACIPRCKHVHNTSRTFEKYDYLEPNTGLLAPPCRHGLNNKHNGACEPSATPEKEDGASQNIGPNNNTPPPPVVARDETYPDIIMKKSDEFENEDADKEPTSHATAPRSSSASQTTDLSQFT